MSGQIDKAVKVIAAEIGMMSFWERAEVISRVLAIDGFAHCQSPEQACRYVETITVEVKMRLVEDWAIASRSFNARDCAGDA